MFLSQSPSGIYHLYFTPAGGKRTKVSTHATSKSDALKFLQNFQESERKKRSKSLKEFLVEYFEYVHANYHYRTYLIYRVTVSHLLKVIPDSILLENITAKHWDLYKTYRLKTVSPVTANIELRAIKSMFNTAARWKEIKESPFDECQRCAVADTNPEYITEEDFERLIAAIEESWLKELVVFTVLTGLRRGEVINLKWNQVNLIKKNITIISSPSFKTKGGRKRTIALNDSALFILNRKSEHKESEYVFTLNGIRVYDEWMSKKFTRYVRKVGIKGKVCFHTLRHTFSSWLVMRGISIYSVSKLLGHSSVVTTQKYYAHLQPDELHDQVNCISINLN